MVKAANSAAGGNIMGGVAEGIGFAKAIVPTVSNFIGDISGANAGARAAENAANAQAAAAGAQAQLVRQEGLNYQNRAMDLAKATPEELMNQERALQAGQKQLASQERLLAAIDPALMEASQQALNLLRGDRAASLGPQETARAQQRQSLLSSLRAQYGPGAESSAIGQKALRDFDMQSTLMTGQIQQQQLGNLTNVFGSFNSQRPDLMQTGAGLMDMGSVFRNRELNTYKQAGQTYLGALSGTSQQIIDNAGAPFVGDAMRARNQQGLFNMAANAGLVYATGGASAAPGMMSKMGGAGGGTGSLSGYNYNQSPTDFFGGK